jgi:hypothetical protein
VRVLDDGPDEPWRCPIETDRSALEVRPPQVGAGACLPPGKVVDLLGAVTPNVTYPQVAGGRVELEARRIPQTVGPDLGPGTGSADERIVGRDLVGRPCGGTGSMRRILP